MKKTAIAKVLVTYKIANLPEGKTDEEIDKWTEEWETYLKAICNLLDVDYDIDKDDKECLIARVYEEVEYSYVYNDYFDYDIPSEDEILENFEPEFDGDYEAIKMEVDD